MSLMYQRPRVIFLHGFFSSGSCEVASALRESLAGLADVESPDLPLHPLEAIEQIKKMIKADPPSLIVGNSNGSFLAQTVVKELCVPALLGNPHFDMVQFLTERVGIHEYKSHRADGHQEFIISQELIDEFSDLQSTQFCGIGEYAHEHVWGIFGEKDSIAHFEPLFLEHYAHSFHFPGGHTPTAEEVKTWYTPLIRQMISKYR